MYCMYVSDTYSKYSYYTSVSEKRHLPVRMKLFQTSKVSSCDSSSGHKIIVSSDRNDFWQEFKQTETQWYVLTKQWRVWSQPLWVFYLCHRPLRIRMPETAQGKILTTRQQKQSGKCLRFDGCWLSLCWLYSISTCLLRVIFVQEWNSWWPQKWLRNFVSVRKISVHYFIVDFPKRTMAEAKFGC